MTFRHGTNLRKSLVCGAIVVVLAVIILWRNGSDSSPAVRTVAAEGGVPRLSAEDGYVGSSACKACHPGEYSTWHRSYHRTMTQPATPDTVVAPFENEQLHFQGQLYRLERQGDRFYVSIDAQADGLDPGIATNAFDRERRQIVMTTGSHHIQVYWISDPPTQLLIELPFYYHISSGRWILRDDTMLHPPGQPQVPSVWNDRCIKCHSVNGIPGLDATVGKFSTRVAELGIACEACHGPGAEHVAFHQGEPGGHGTGLIESAMVNPRQLDAQAATQVCGRCHSASQPIDPEQYLLSGLGHRPGDDLHAFVKLNAFDPRRERPVIDRAGAVFVEDYPIDGYWKDGTCRVGGDEYNALIESPCYQRGALSCLSCHSMHDSDPNDQLAAAAQDNRACTQCHQGPRFNEQLATHTHHAPESPGSQCYNCHMPHTTYALLTSQAAEECVRTRGGVLYRLRVAVAVPA